jgi:carbon monoxide dehydrogenase subunit G
MQLEVQVPVNATKAEIWAVISNIENAASTIEGIELVEILDKPENGLVGLKWRETRTMFGKTATEVMWITEAKTDHYYKTRAESHGAVYTSMMAITEEAGQVYLNMSFSAEAQNIGAKIVAALLGGMMKKATQKALLKDLEDIKKAVESK